MIIKDMQKEFTVTFCELDWGDAFETEDSVFLKIDGVSAFDLKSGEIVEFSPHALVRDREIEIILK